MKKTFLVFLAIVMVLSLAACGGGSQTTNTPTPTPTAEPTLDMVPEVNQEPQKEQHTNEFALEEFKLSTEWHDFSFKIRNLTDDKVDSVSITLQFLDRNGDSVGTAGGVVDNMDSGQAAASENWSYNKSINLNAVSKIKIYEYMVMNKDHAGIFEGTFEPAIILDMADAKKGDDAYSFTLVNQSNDMSNEEAWDTLFSYIDSRGDSSDTQNYLEDGETAKYIQKTYTNGNTQIAIIPTDHNRILLYACIYKSSEFAGNKFSTFRQLTLTLHADSTMADYDMFGVASDTLTGTSFEHGIGVLDITTADADTVLEVDNYEYTDVDGNVSTDAPGADLVQFFNELYQDIINDTPEILEDTGLGITMGMLGFDSME